MKLFIVCILLGAALAIANDASQEDHPEHVRRIDFGLGDDEKDDLQKEDVHRNRRNVDVNPKHVGPIGSSLGDDEENDPQKEAVRRDRRNVDVNIVEIHGIPETNIVIELPKSSSKIISTANDSKRSADNREQAEDEIMEKS